jgi:acyl phosphate:glycerol-3-phosphate acyltransferase
MHWSEPDMGTAIQWVSSLLAVASSYVIGCFTAGYYLVRYRTGVDVRKSGSGSAGATNVGRMLGKAGFCATLALDMVKGALVAWAVLHLGLEPRIQLLSMIAVVAGHIWPAQLHFRGGKGVATLLGVVVVSDVQALLIMGGLSLVALGLLRRFTLSGLLAMAAAPLAVICWSRSATRALGLLLLVVPVLIAHSSNIREEIGWLRGVFAGRSSAALPPHEE